MLPVASGTKAAGAGAGAGWVRVNIERRSAGGSTLFTPR